MFETKIDIGRGIVQSMSSLTLKKENSPLNLWRTIEDFGIQRTDLKKLAPTYQELFEIYSTIRAFQTSSDFLKKLKIKLG